MSISVVSLPSSISLRSVFTTPRNSIVALTSFAMALFLLLCPVSERCAAQAASTAQTQTLKDHVRIAANGQRVQFLSVLPKSQKIELAIVLPLRNEAQLDALLKRLYDPSSVDYQKFLSVEEFTSQFGPTEADYQAVVDFATKNGLTVTGTTKNRLIVPVEGTAAQINAAFNVSMGLYQHPLENRAYYSPDREPLLAASVPIAHIDGMNTFSLPRSLVVLPAVSQPMASVNGSGPNGSYLGSDMRAAYYGGSILTGLGQSVAVVEFGGYLKSDVDLSFSNAGQTYSVPLTDVLVGGATNTVYKQDGEQVLDIVQAIGMAPGLSGVSVYIGSPTSSSSPALVLNQIATDNTAKQIGCSWGWIPDSISTHDGFLKEMAAQGQTFLAASGDDGAFQYSISPYFYPGESQYATGVGGTHLTVTGPGGAWSAEAAWNSKGYGSGGGVSPDGIALPSWQAGLATTTNGGSSIYRNVPDVAMEADFDNYMCNLGTCYTTGAGTSFAAPRWAGFMALVNQQAVEAGNAPAGGIGFINVKLLQVGTGSNYGTDFHDVQLGNNNTANQTTWFNAVPGYDLVTGWGSPTGQELIDELAGKAIPGFWISPASGSVTVLAGNSGTATINVTTVGGFTSNVALSVASTLPSGVTASFSPDSTTTSSVLKFTADSSAVPGNYQVNVRGTSGSITQSTSLMLVVHGPSFTLTASNTSLTISQRTSVKDTITVNDLYGFTDKVDLQVSGLPAGVTGSFGTNPTSTTSVLTLTASTSAASWTGYVTVTGTSGALTASTSIYVSIVAPNFTLSTPSSVALGQGQTYSTWINVYSQNGFTGSVTVSISGLPSGVSAFVTPNPISSGGQITFTASSTAAIGTSPVTITGTFGSITATSTTAVTVKAPTFTVSGPGSISVGQGSTATGYAYVNAQYGFSGSANLAVTGLPAGVTASLAPNPTTYNSQITISAATSAVPGTYTATITGTASTITASTTFSLIVGTPTFTISGPGSTTLSQGGSQSNWVYVNGQFGFNGSVVFSASGLPSGVTVTFPTNPATYSTQINMTASAAAATGTSTITITGTSGSITRTATIPLTIVAPSLQLSGGGPVTLGIGSTASVYPYVYGNNGYSGTATFSISGLPSGITASFSPNPVTFSSSPGSSQITFTASSSVAAGSYIATLTASSGSVTASTSITLTVAVPSFTLSGGTALTLGQGGTSSAYIYVSGINGFNGNVTLSVSGLPTGVTAAFGTNPTAYNSYLTFAATSAAPTGTYTVTVTGTSGSLTATTTISLTIASPSFTLGNGSTVTVGQGGSYSTYIYVNGSNGFNGNVTLSVSGLPTGVTAAFGTNPTTYSSQLTFTASSSAPTGSYSVTVTGTSGSATATTTVALTVVTPSFTLSPGGSSYTLSQGSSTSSYLYLTGANGFSGAVSLSVTGLPPGVTVGFGSNPTSSYYTTMTITASGSAMPGNSTVTITGTWGSITASTTMIIAVTGPTFALAAVPGSMNIFPGATATTSVAVIPVLGFSGNVSFSISGLPTGVTAAWNPTTSSTGSVLTLTASSTAAVGKATAIITGTSGALTVNAQIPVNVRSLASASTAALAMTSGGSPVSTIAWGKTVKLTASVAMGGSPVTAGVVNFCDSAASYCGDIHLLGTAQLTSAGTASISLIPLPGSHSYQAVFAGTPTASPSSSSAGSLLVTGTYPTATILTSSGAVGNYSLAAQMIGAGTQTMTGKVSFVNTSAGNSVVGSANLVAGTPTLGWAQLSSPPVGPSSSTVVTADFNGDGIADAAILDPNYDAISILLGNADGTFTMANLSPQTGGAGAGITTGDFNGDGFVDLAVINGNGVVNVYLGNGDGTFKSLSSITTVVSYGMGILSGDLNNDGIADLAVTDSNNSQVVTLLGKGDGTFTAVSTTAPTGTQPGSLVAGDFNNDGNLDLAVSGSYGTISLLFGKGDGTFATSAGLTAGSYGARSIVLGDFNRDGIPDLAMSNASSSTVSIFLGKGDGTFTATSSPTIPNSSTLMIAIDANQDGTADLFIGSSYGTSGTLLLNNGDGTFTLGNSLTLSTGMNGLAPLRGTSSGYPALIATFGSNTALVLQPYTAQLATANVTGISMGATGSNYVAANYSGDTNYSSSQSQTVTLRGTKYDSIITWAPPAAISYGTALSSTQLNATANVPGTFVYTPAAGTVPGAGTQTLSVTFTPTDTANYTTVTATARLVVNKAASTLTWATPAAIIYGTALSSTQLNASSNVPGSFTYTPAAGAVLGVGTQALSAAFTPTDTANYTAATATTQLVVNKASPTISWATPAAIGYGTALSSLQLSATANVPGAFAYTPAAGTILGAGTQTLSLAFTPSDTTNYAATTSTVQLVVNKAAPTLTWATPAAITYGTALGSTQLNASSTVAGSFTYMPAAGVVLGVGTQTLTASFAPTDAANYTAATATAQLVVNKATPTISWTTPAPIGYGTALSSTQLNATASTAGTFAYTPAAGTVLSIGNNTLSVVFTPTDATDYINATATVMLVVNSQNPVPVISSLTPAFTSAGSGTFALAVNGANFVSGSTIYLGTTALTTQVVNATQLSGSVPASLVASAGAVSVTVQSPAPGGGTSNVKAFEIDTAGSSAGAPTFTTLTATVTAGAQATYALTLPASATNVSVSCLNLPNGANCSYSASAGTLTITTSNTTPSGTYQIIVVFTETLPGAAAGYILLPFLLVPLWFLRRRPVFRSLWATLALLVALATLPTIIGCGGGSGGGGSTTPPPATHQVTSSAVLTLIVK